jgi:hypothetical protein
MNEQIVKTNNRLIAEFMGVKPVDGWYNGWELHKAGVPFAYGAMGNGTHDLKFHTSWDWLMPVVGKITSTNEEPEELDNLRAALLCADLQTAFSEVCNILSNDFINL